MSRFLSVLGVLIAPVIAGSTPAAAQNPVACAAACEAESAERYEIQTAQLLAELPRLQLPVHFWWCRSGQRNYERLQPSARIRYCEVALQQEPIQHRSEIYRGMAAAYAEMEDYFRALEYYEFAINLAPRSNQESVNVYHARTGMAWAATERAVIDLEAGNLGRAQHFAEMAAEIADDWYDSDRREAMPIWENLSLVYTAQGMVDEAFDAFLTAVMLGDRAYISDVQERLWGQGFYDGAFDGMDSGALRSAIRECIEAQCLLEG